MKCAAQGCVFGAKMLAAGVLTALCAGMLSAGSAMAAPATSIISAGAELLQPHRAIYTLKLETAEAATDIGSIEGRMVLEWRGGPGCDGYTVTQRVVTRISDTDGTLTTRDMRHHSWESIQGDIFRFGFDQYVNGRLAGRVSGTATRKKGAGRAVFSSPAGTELLLPDDVVFPSEFTVELLEAASRGERTVSRSIFEGAESDRRFDVTAFIGEAGTTPDDAGAADIEEGKGLALTGMKTWPVHMSYFDPKTADGLPSYEVSYWLFENGISASLLMDYGGFVLRGDLDALVYFDPDDC